VPRRVFITVAEVSGDQHAAGLVRALKQLDPEMVIEGHGGPRMREAGAIIHTETTAGAAMGWRGALRAWEMWKLLRWTRWYFDEHRPDVHICIDSPALNFHFAKLAKGREIPVLYYVAPQLWGWREGRMKRLRRRVDHVACILPFEEEYFRGHGVPATFVGHPLFDEWSGRPSPRPSPETMEKPEKGAATLIAGATHEVARAPVTVGLLPGSRRGEATANFPPLLAAAARIQQAFAEVRFLVPTTPATHPVVEQFMTRGTGHQPVRERLDYRMNAFDELVPRCDLCLVVSGTATLHVAIHGVPMIVVYRGSRLLWHLVARWVIRTRTFALVNLLNDDRRHIVPEYVPWDGSAEPLADHAIDLLKHPGKLEAQRVELRRLVDKLAQPGAAMNTAQLAMELMTV
jgi:lipid-A-disaccharide synthase